MDEDNQHFISFKILLAFTFKYWW